MSCVWTCLCVWTCMCVGREGVFVTECNTGAGKHRGTNAQWWHSKEIATTHERRTWPNERISQSLTARDLHRLVLGACDHGQQHVSHVLNSHFLALLGEVVRGSQKKGGRSSLQEEDDLPHKRAQRVSRYGKRGRRGM